MSYGEILDSFPTGDLKMESGHGICDFCSPPQPSMWLYPCESFAVPLPKSLQGAYGKREGQYHGDWGACTACAVLIEAENRPELVDRAGPFPYPILRELQVDTIDLFFLKRITTRDRKYCGGQSSKFYGHVVISPDGKY